LKIIYHCFGGAHASPTTAAIHLKLISNQHLPAITDFKNISKFDVATSQDHGKLNYLGVDHLGNEIYIMGRAHQAPLVTNLIKEFVKLSGGNPDDYCFINCCQSFNLLMVIGGFSSRRLGLVWLGRPLVSLGTLLAFPKLVGIVQKIWISFNTPHLTKS